LPGRVVAVVFTVSIVATEADPFKAADELPNEHVGVEAAAEGVTAQLSATVPVKLAGVTVMVELPLFPAVRLMDPLLESVYVVAEPAVTVRVP
jgi:hypothetical protein